MIKTILGDKKRYYYHFLWNFYCAEGTLWQAVSGWSGRIERLSSSHSGGQTNQYFYIRLAVWHKKVDMQLLVIAATVYMQKALDFSTPAKNRIKMS
jgi:hypothetical protein